MPHLLRVALVIEVFAVIASSLMAFSTGDGFKTAFWLFCVGNTILALVVLLVLGLEWATGG